MCSSDLASADKFAGRFAGNSPGRFAGSLAGRFVGQIVGLADDPKMKAIVVSHGIPGTTEGFRRVRERRPDILLFVEKAHEDLNVVASAADLVVNADSFSRGYLIPLAAKEVGAKNFVHISFPRHMSFETLGRRRAIKLF